MSNLKVSFRRRAGIVHSAEHVSCHTLWGSGMLNPWLEPHHCMYICSAKCESKMISQEVSRYRTRVESEDSAVHKWQSTQVMAATLALTSPEIQNKGNQWPHKKDWYPPKYLLNKVSFRIFYRNPLARPMHFLIHSHVVLKTFPYSSSVRMA